MGEIDIVDNRILLRYNGTVCQCRMGQNAIV